MFACHRISIAPATPFNYRVTKKWPVIVGQRATHREAGTGSYPEVFLLEIAPHR